MYITSADQLKIFCDNLKSAEILAVDTEFVRETTYFHRIGLIQVGSGEHFAAIDPVLLSDLTPLLELLKDPTKIKIFHAARQDLEILERLCGRLFLRCLIPKSPPLWWDGEPRFPLRKLCIKL